MIPNGPGSPATSTELELRWRSSRHTRRLLTLGLTGLFIAVLARRPEFAGLAAPALVLLAAGRARTLDRQLARITVRAKPTTRRAFEEERLAVDVTADGTDDCSVRWRLHPGLEIAPVGATAADGRQARFVVTPERWGRRQIGTLEVTLRDRWRLAEGHATMTLPRLDCYPAPARQRTTVVLRRLPNRLGEHPARTAGEGIEFSGVREYVPGDRQRSINWAASTRRGRLQVNTFAAERSQDVVLLVDATSDVGQPGSSALDLALRGAGAAARAYLEARDRVGVITYQWGGSSWLAPALGRRQVYRIIDSMLASDAGYARGASFARLPRAALPPGCAGGGVQPAARPAVRGGAAGHARARLQHARRRRAEHRAVGQAADRGQNREAAVADGAGRDQVLAARAGRPGRALGRRGAARPAAGRAHPASDGGPPVSGLATGLARAVGMRAAAVLLGAGCLVWAALPAAHRGWAGFALTLAIAGVAAGGLRLALAAVPVPDESYWPSPGVRAWRTFLDMVRQVPWEEGAVIGIAWLEVLHPSRPWHTAVLGAGLIAYLLIAHLAESDAPLATLRPQARVLALGAVLLALGAGAGMLPAAGPGAGSALLRLVAAGALIAAAGLVLPYIARDV